MRPVNLIPQDQRRRRPSESSGKGAHVLLGLLAVLLAMSAAYVLTANTVTERKNETEQARVEADRLEAEAASKGGFSGFEQIAQTRAASVVAVASTRFDWERFMRELSRVMPEGSWLMSANASAAAATAETDTASTDDPAAAAPSGPTANLVGCTPKHSDVARMMVRLRQLHRVADVSLTQSSYAEEAGPAAIDSCGPNANFDLTLTFHATPPAAEAPRGAPRVPVSLGGGS